MYLKVLKKSVFLLFLILLFYSCTSKPDNDKDLNFTLNSLKDGSAHTLNDYRGDPVVLNFWASWCAPCREEMPLLQHVWLAHRNDDIKFIGVNIMDNKEDALAFLGKIGVSYPNLYDKDGKVSDKFGVSVLPVTVFMDSTGKIVKKKYGPYLGKNGEKLFESDLLEITK